MKKRKHLQVMTGSVVQVKWSLLDEDLPASSLAISRVSHERESLGKRQSL